jgi:gamma-glutamylcyclotransferase (GGCT)/AIG2-like uncharacterized protein YtfP
MEITDDNETTNALFVYGTLKPGKFRFSVLEPYIDKENIGEASVRGILYDSGSDWPAAVFSDDITETVNGFVVYIDKSKLNEALSYLDEAEGVNSGLFCRALVTTNSKIKCWAYEYMKSVEGFRRIQSWEKY